MMSKIRSRSYKGMTYRVNLRPAKKRGVDFDRDALKELCVLMGVTKPIKLLPVDGKKDAWIDGLWGLLAHWRGRHYIYLDGYGHRGILEQTLRHELRHCWQFEQSGQPWEEWLYYYVQYAEAELERDAEAAEGLFPEIQVLTFR